MDFKTKQAKTDHMVKVLKEKDTLSLHDALPIYFKTKQAETDQIVKVLKEKRKLNSYLVNHR